MEKRVRNEVSQRWIDAIERVIYEKKASSYRDIESLTGINHQRINNVKQYLKGKRELAAYADVQHILSLCNKLGISVEYIMTGAGPFYKESYESKESISMVAEESVDIDYGTISNKKIIAEVIKLRIQVEKLLKAVL